MRASRRTQSRARAAAGVICLNGAAARLAQPGDLVIVLSYAQYAEADTQGFEPVVVHVDEANREIPTAARIGAGRVGRPVAMYSVPRLLDDGPSGQSAGEIRASKGRRRLAMLTAYDYPTALALDASGLDLILVGDSLAEVELGLASTREISLAIMCHHVRAVHRGVTRTHLVGDLPTDTYRTPAGGRRECTCPGRGGRHERQARRRVGTAGQGDHRRRHTRSWATSVCSRKPTPNAADAAEHPKRPSEILDDAIALDRAGCYAIVIEAVDGDVAASITAAVAAPTIGIAAGLGTDGQVLVSTDLIGQLPEPPRFVTPKANVFQVVIAAGREFAHEVRSPDASAVSGR